MVYTLTLNPSLDYVLNVDNLTLADINRAKNTDVTFGGKGVNVSYILSQLGVDNVALGFVAGDFGKKFLSLVKDAGVNADFCHLSQGETRINVKIRSGNELDINVDGPIVNYADVKMVIDKLTNALQSGDFLVLSGSVPKGLDKNIYSHIITATQHKNVNTVVDAQGQLLTNTLPLKPFLIKPNHHELGEILNCTVNDVETAVDGAKKLQQMGAKNVLVSMSEKGAVLLTETGKVVTSQNAKGTLVNSVGCGDSMVAGFLAGYIQGNNYEYALKLATASANATAYTRNLATKQQINSCITNNTVL